MTEEKNDKNEEIRHKEWQSAVQIFYGGVDIVF
jgi:hypothetical protein